MLLPSVDGARIPRIEFAGGTPPPEVLLAPGR